MIVRIYQYFNEGIIYFKCGILQATLIYIGILALIYILNKTNLKKVKFSIMQGIMGYLLAIYTMAILQITGVAGIRGMQYHLSWFMEGIQMIHFGIPFVGSSALMVMLNTVLFIPFGFLIPIVIRNKKWSWQKALLLGFAFSCCIEFLQLFGGRFFEFDDLITNSVGTMIGYLIWETLAEFKEKDTRRKATIKGVSIIAGVAIMSIVLIFIANGDRIQAAEEAERYAMYNQIGCDEEQYKDIRSMVLYNTNNNNNFDEQEIYDEIGMDISNLATWYTGEYFNSSIENIVEDSLNQYVEILFNNKHTFTFYNNDDLVLEEVQHILYNLNDGTIYCGQDDSNIFTQVFKYENAEYPFIKNNRLSS